MKPIGTFRVSTPEFRKAIDAVRRHADKTKTGGDGTQALRRIRMLFDPPAGHVRVMATCITTSAVAVVPLITADGGLLDLIDAADGQGKAQQPAVVDILPQHAARILGAFPVTKDADGQQIVVEVYDGESIIRDIGGLMAGDGLIMTAPPDGEGFPDVYGIVGKASLDSTSTPSPKPLTVDPIAFGRFVPLKRIYDFPVSILPAGSADSRGFVIACGPSFRAVVSSGHADDDSLAKREQAENVWLQRFTGKTLKAVK